MHIGYDISQTGSGKAGCGYFAHALIKAMLGACAGASLFTFPQLW